MARRRDGLRPVSMAHYGRIQRLLRLGSNTRGRIGVGRLERGFETPLFEDQIHEVVRSQLDALFPGSL